MLRAGEHRDNVKLWRDAALGSHGVDLFAPGISLGGARFDLRSGR